MQQQHQEEDCSTGCQKSVQQEKVMEPVVAEEAEKEHPVVVNCKKIFMPPGIAVVKTV